MSEGAHRGQTELTEITEVRGSSQRSEGIQKYLRESRGSSHRSYGDHRGQTELVEVRRSSQGLTEDRGSP